MNKPVILAGWGVISDHAEAEFAKFITCARAPVLLTWKAMGLLPDCHPLYSGRPGMVGQPAANRILQECDYLLVLGAKMDKDQTAYQLQNIAPNAVKEVVDIDEAELKKFPSSWKKHHTTTRLYMMRHQDDLYRAEWVQYCRRLVKRYPVVNPAWWREEAVNYYCFLEELSYQADADDVIAPECSNAAPPLFQTWRVKLGQQFTYAGALGSMGQGIPGAIGAALATGKRVISVIGDGGFMLNIQELEVVRRLNLPIKFFVIDNGGYGAIRNTQDAYFAGRRVGCDADSGLTLPSIGGLVEAFGIDTMTLIANRTIHEIVEIALDGNEPVVVVVKIPADFKTAYVVSKRMEGGVPVAGDFAEI
jgi:acetolactate synthase I/II/III large subunit